MFYDEWFVYLSVNLGQPIDQIKFLIALLLPYPLGYIIQLFRSPTFRFIYSLICGILLIIFLYGRQIVFVIGELLLAYILMRFLPRKYIGWTMMIFVVLCVSCSHVWRMSTDYGGWQMDVSTVIMIMTMTYSGLGWDLRDGAIPVDQLSSYQRYHRLKDAPSLIELFGFTFYFGQCNLGPIYTMRDYRDWISLSGNYENIPQTVTSSLFRLCQGLLALGALIILGSNLPFTILQDKKGLQNYPLYLQIGIFHLIMIGVRTRYYVGWILADGAAKATGMAYCKSPTSEEMISVGVLACETSVNTRTITNYWNHSAHIWLKYYVYNRFIGSKRDRVKVANWATYIFSAIWHGYYPIYYVVFIIFAIVNDNFNSLNKIALKHKTFRSHIFIILYWLFAVFSLDYMGAIFVGLFLHTGWNITIQAGVCWIPLLHIFFFILFMTTSLGKIKGKIDIKDYPQGMRVYHLIPFLRPKQIIFPKKDQQKTEKVE